MINNKRILLRLLKIKGIDVNQSQYRRMLENPTYRVIDNSLNWASTEEGFDFWLVAQMDYAYILCKKNFNRDCFFYYKSLFQRIKYHYKNEDVEKHKILLKELIPEYES